MTERRRLPDRRRAINWHLRLGGQGLYLCAGLYDDGSPGEVFLTLSKAGSTLRSMADGWARMVSYALQHGTPLASVVRANRHTRFEPAGPVEGHPRITHSTSLLDLCVRVLGLEFLPDRDDLADVGAAPVEAPAAVSEGQTALLRRVEAAPGNREGAVCDHCGSANMQRAGACLVCADCGTSGGCG